MVATAHDPVLGAPYYSADAEGATLHRYFDDAFVERFLFELASGQLRGSSQQAWRQEDRFADYLDAPTLRLPIHRTFYMICCEVSCKMLGSPAFDPQRIVSAGFAIRRRGAVSQWMVVGGIARGWERAETGARDPDVMRRLVNRNLLRRDQRPTLTTGEQTYPLTKTVITVREGSGAARNRTILYGYLPLGGAYSPQQSSAPKALAAGANDPSEKSASLREFQWPFGTGGAFGSWSEATGRIVRNGKPTVAFFLVLRASIERYRIHDARSALNLALRTLLEKIPFIVVPPSIEGSLARPGLLRVLRALLPRDGSSLEAVVARARYGLKLPQATSFTEVLLDPRAAAYLGGAEVSALLQQGGARAILVDETTSELLKSATRGPTLLDYLDAQMMARVGSEGEERFALLEYLVSVQATPATPLSSVEARLPECSASSQLWMLEEEAEDLRELLVERLREETTERRNELLLPRFAQGPEELYAVVPFLRYRDPQGCERVAWGQASLPFRVAAPFDPEASRPCLIQIPSLKDLRRGSAKGAAFLLPADVAKKIHQFSPDMPPEQEGWGASFGVMWIFSLSIPIVTFCAMLLLMLIVYVLNLIFFWLPYVFVAIPLFFGKVFRTGGQGAGAGTSTGGSSP